MTLSELVAVEVMGWRKFARNDGPWLSVFVMPPREQWWGVDTDRRGLFMACGIVGPFDEYDGDKPGTFVRVPDYDTNIADAWRVVEKCVKFDPQIYHRKPDWVCLMFNEQVDDAMPLGGNDENVCVAICLAALRACGVSEDRIEQARRKA